MESTPPFKSEKDKLQIYQLQSFDYNQFQQTNPSKFKRRLPPVHNYTSSELEQSSIYEYNTRIKNTGFNSNCGVKMTNPLLMTGVSLNLSNKQFNNNNYNNNSSKFSSNNNKYMEIDYEYSKNQVNSIKNENNKHNNTNLHQQYFLPQTMLDIQDMKMRMKEKLLKEKSNYNSQVTRMTNGNKYDDCCENINK